MNFGELGPQGLPGPTVLCLVLHQPLGNLMTSPPFPRLCLPSWNQKGTGLQWTLSPLHIPEATAEGGQH